MDRGAYKVDECQKRMTIRTNLWFKVQVTLPRIKYNLKFGSKIHVPLQRVEFFSFPLRCPLGQEILHNKG